MNRRDNPNSSVNNKNKVYCMNVEYDFVRDILMQKGNEELGNDIRGIIIIRDIIVIFLQLDVSAMNLRKSMLNE